MAVQLPPEELGTAVAILVYSFFCLACSCTMAWLTHVHREAISYVALVSYFTGLSTAGSIAQQLHTLVRWRDIKLEQFHHSAAHVGNPELAIAGQSTGLDLVLFYIQFYCYNVEAALTFFWAIALTQSIFQLEPVKSRRRRVNYIAKGVAVLLPALLMGILRLEAVQQRAVTFLILADSISNRPHPSSTHALAEPSGLTSMRTSGLLPQRQRRPAHRHPREVHAHAQEPPLVERPLRPALRQHQEQRHHARHRRQRGPPQHQEHIRPVARCAIQHRLCLVSHIPGRHHHVSGLVRAAEHARLAKRHAGPQHVAVTHRPRPLPPGRLREPADVCRVRDDQDVSGLPRREAGPREGSKRAPPGG